MYVLSEKDNPKTCTETGQHRRAVEEQSKRLVHIIASDFLFEVVWQTPLKTDKSTGANIQKSNSSVSQIFLEQESKTKQSSHQQNCSM